MNRAGLSQSNSLTTTVAYTSDPNLESQALTILQGKCGSCHQSATAGGVGPILNVGYLLATGLIAAGNPMEGRLTGSIRDGSMPKSGAAVTANELLTIENWISSIQVTGTLPSVTDLLPPGKTVDADPTLHNQAMKIININCAGCHQNITSGGIGSILDVRFLVKNGLVTPGSPNVGRLIGAIEDTSMPKGKAARVTASDLQTLKNWIFSMQIVDDVGQPPLPTRVALDSSFQGIFANIIEPKCVGCHGPVRAADGKRYDSYNLVSSHISDIESKCSSGEMPESPYPVLNNAELSALNGWIQSGTPNN